MKLSILTTITNPVDRQDQWLEALENYCALADEVIVVNGGKPIILVDVEFNKKIKIVDLDWPFEWNWVEYPRHLNYGLKFCTGDFVLRLDIDQLVHEKDFEDLRGKLAVAPQDCHVVTMQKMSYTYQNKYYQKGETEVIIRRIPRLKFGKAFGQSTDLCFPIIEQQTESILLVDHGIYNLPVGTKARAFKSGVSYHNYDYYFRDREVARREFWRASRAWERYFNRWTFGSDEDKAFELFCNMIKARHDKSTLEAKLEDHPQSIRKVIENIPEDRLGYNGWGIL